MKYGFNRLICVIAIGAAIVSAMVAEGNVGMAKETSKLSVKDRAFLKDAAEIGIMEVKLGEFGKEKATSEDVKALAGHLVKDHAKANEELIALAKSKGIELASEPTAAQKTMLAAFEKRDKGEGFDKEFIEHTMKDHQRAITLFEKTAKGATDAEIKAFAEKMVPALKEHLAMARKNGGMKNGEPEKPASATPERHPKK